MQRLKDEARELRQELLIQQNLTAAGGQTRRTSSLCSPTSPITPITNGFNQMNINNNRAHLDQAENGVNGVKSKQSYLYGAIKNGDQNGKSPANGTTVAQPVMATNCVIVALIASSSFVAAAAIAFAVDAHIGAKHRVRSVAQSGRAGVKVGIVSQPGAAEHAQQEERHSHVGVANADTRFWG